MKVSEREFESYARRMLRLSERRGQVCSEEHHRIFRGLFGCPFKVVSKLWNMLDPIGKMSNRCKPIHLLWTLVFLKVYKSEAVHCRIVGCKSRDTYRNWVDRFTEAIADLAEDVIVFSNRFKEWDGQTRCLICIDGTDVPILEPGSRSSLWWSHKFNGPGVRYEVATCIKTGDIVWFRGPLPCNMSDREIFDMFLSEKLIPGEGVEADSGYTGRSQIFTAAVGKTRTDRKQKSQVRGRHETVNGRLKIFGVMKEWHSPNTAKHAVMARSVAVIVQLSFSLGDKLYDVDYNVNYD